MKTNKSILSIPFIFLISTALNMTLWSGSSYAQSQSGLTSSAANSYKQADGELNKVYQNILREYATKTQFIKNIKAAQRLWLKLRDADLAARFPEKGQYGSAEPMCRESYLESLTRDRIKVLKVWADGIPEGDVCNGSVKTR